MNHLHMLNGELLEISSYTPVEEWFNKLQYISTISSRHFPLLKIRSICVYHLREMLMVK